MTSPYERIQVSDADITKVGHDAIVVSTKENFLDGGLARAVHQAAGPQLEHECVTLTRFTTGESRIASGYKLPAKHVIFTVGPTWTDGHHGEDKLLADCYKSCLTLAKLNKCKSVAFSAISCREERFPYKRAISIAVSEVSQFLSQNRSMCVAFVCHDDAFPTVSQWYKEELHRQKTSGENIFRQGSDSAINMASVFGHIRIVVGDITRLDTDAIVNAANRTLLGGGGVDGAIHRAAGTRLLSECKQMNGCHTGVAKITNGYRLPAKYVIHAVGPVWYGGQQNEDDLLRSCYWTSMELAVRYKCQSVAFPAISCGAYGFPFARAASIAMDTILAFKRETSSDIRVTFCCFRSEDTVEYQRVLQSAKLRFGV